MRNWLRAAALAGGLALLPTAGMAAPKAPAKRQAPVRRKAPPAPKTKAKPPAPPAEEGDGQAIRRGERVEFDARLIQGQTAKAGAVYLFERVSSDLSSMVQERKSYRREIVEEVFPQESVR